MVWSRPLSVVPGSVTIIKGCAGRSVASFVVAVEREPLPPNGNAVDVDLGLASLAVTHDGVKIAPLMFLRTAFKGMRRLQRRLSRKARGTNNHAMVADQRPDPLHKLATGPVREHRTVCIEHLNGVGMVKNRKLVRSMAAAGWRLLRILLASRAGMDGPTVQAVSHWQPASSTCWECGHRDGKKDVSIRWWRCPASGAEQDRDGNAACSILAAGLGEGATPVEPRGRPAGWPLAVRQEPT